MYLVNQTFGWCLDVRDSPPDNTLHYLCTVEKVTVGGMVLAFLLCSSLLGLPSWHKAASLRLCCQGVGQGAGVVSQSFKVCMPVS